MLFPYNGKASKQIKFNITEAGAFIYSAERLNNP